VKIFQEGKTAEPLSNYEPLFLAKGGNCASTFIETRCGD